MARIAGEAPCGRELAVHVEHPFRTGPLVQIVDILSDDQQFARPFRIKPRQRLMRGIGLHVPQPFAPRIIEFLDELRIAEERLRRRHILHPVPLP